MRVEFVIGNNWHRLSYCLHCQKVIWFREGTFSQRFALRFDIQPWNICEDCNDVTPASTPWSSGL